MFGLSPSFRLLLHSNLTRQLVSGRQAPRASLLTYGTNAPLHTHSTTSAALLSSEISAILLPTPTVTKVT